MREYREQQIRANLQRLVRAHAAAMAVLEEFIAILLAQLAEYFPEDPPPQSCQSKSGIDRTTLCRESVATGTGHRYGP